MQTTLILLALVLVGCSPNPVFPDGITNGFVRVHKSALHAEHFSDYRYAGHSYLHCSHSLIHAEHCPCKALWNTNAALNNDFLRSMMSMGTNAISP